MQPGVPAAPEERRCCRYRSAQGRLFPEEKEQGFLSAVCHLHRDHRDGLSKYASGSNQPRVVGLAYCTDLGMRCAYKVHFTLF